MDVRINIKFDMLPELSKALNSTTQNDLLKIERALGHGHIRRTLFSDNVEFFHFSFTFKEDINLTCINPADSDHFLLKVNLSDQLVEKRINENVLENQKYLPSGIIYYSPNTRVDSFYPAGKPIEVALIRFPKSFLTIYFADGEDVFLNIKDKMVYEDLDFNSEKALLQIIHQKHKLKSHSSLLGVLSTFFEKLSRRVTDLNYVNLHPQDNKQLYLAASLLRTPTNNNIPSVEELARTAKMGTTKFKTTFKQVFGNSPKKYHQKIKMEYALEELLKDQKSTKDIAYELGYSHPSKFTRAFKKYYGIPPSKLK